MTRKAPGVPAESLVYIMYIIGEFEMVDRYGARLAGVASSVAIGSASAPRFQRVSLRITAPTDPS